MDNEKLKELKKQLAEEAITYNLLMKDKNKAREEFSDISEDLDSTIITMTEIKMDIEKLESENTTEISGISL